MIVLQDYVNAANCYEQLVLLSTNEQTSQRYRLHYANALYQASLFDEAYKVTLQMDDIPELKLSLHKLRAAIEYARDDVSSAAKELQAAEDHGDPDVQVNHACILYKENKFEEARQKFQTAMQAQGYSAQLCYAAALCCYRLKLYQQALKHIADIIERGIREHPELSVGMATEGIEVHVRNSAVLRDTALVEAFNLKAAIEFQLNNIADAKEALTDMPPRAQQDIDAVSLHNQALIQLESSPSSSFDKLHFLVEQGSGPAEAFANLVLVCCRFEHYDLAADVLAEHADIAHLMLAPHIQAFLEAVIACQTSPDEAYQKLDDMGQKHIEALRRLKKSNADAEYDEELKRYMPVLMAQAKIYWDLENYVQVEKLFKKSLEFCGDQQSWKTNAAHVLFMQGDRFKEASTFYESLLKNSSNVLDVPAVVLANLCVCYIMTSRNEEAEELMRRIEQAEEQLAYTKPNEKVYHLCIVNLVIGTLYCAKGNYDFGVSRIIKSIEPVSNKLSPDTWFYVKRCFISLIENLAKKVIVVRDAVVHDCRIFLSQCEQFGYSVCASFDDGRGSSDVLPATVASEARLLLALFAIINE
ncbi:tetratricopeptide repeat protein 30A-like isoform X2 [Varroa jacobsoni]|uniref:Tetratricopeptide repeat protein 30 n=1 Tax=Varroa destructor TaxID=109461 RepID=A0A7M7K7J6_VARDE|nr:tetratricopeptide repeat protein 30A-like isoform X2 [Varroa destructor]XP_022693558.1 tetratricopeptide repeat protein 30A-like isoform X2 [Varroa jacobsoni]